MLCVKHSTEPFLDSKAWYVPAHFPHYFVIFSVTGVGILRREDSGNASSISASSRPSREASQTSPSLISGPSGGGGSDDYSTLLPEADQQPGAGGGVKQFGHQQRRSNNSLRSPSSEAAASSVIEIEEMEFDPKDRIGKEEREGCHEEQRSHGTRGSRSSSNFVTFSNDQSPSRKKAGRQSRHAPPTPPPLRSAIEIKASLSRRTTPTTGNSVVRRLDETPGMDFSV